jgi:hypothetical protein
VSGTKYKVGAIVHTGFHNLLPAFSIIKKIVVVNADLNRLYFVINSLNTTEFNEHYHSYEIKKPRVNSVNVCTQEEFISFLPTHFTNPVNAEGAYVSMKYDIDLLNMN